MSDSSENGLAFSIALIARNEAQNLPRLFAGLAEYSRRGGEILVVDTGSDDDTVALAREQGARVIERPAEFDLFLSGAQAERIEQAFARGGHVGIIGGGFIGLELASSAVARTPRRRSRSSSAIRSAVRRRGGAGSSVPLSSALDSGGRS